jgi:tRNA G18 (ribose-2'-O)-methylase SpoU
MARLPVPTLPELLPRCGRVVVLEDVNSHTNIGAIFRCAGGLGMDAVLLSPSCADPLYRRSVRVSMGEVFAIPYARFAAWPAGLGELQDAGFQVLALTPDADATALDTLSFSDDDKVALLLGAEGPGLSKGALAGSALAVRIPMSAGVDSLNVAAATAVACYALRRPGRG